MKGDVLIEMLLAASPGEATLVGSARWTSLDDLEFEVAENFGDGDARFVKLDDEQEEIDVNATYDFTR